MSATPAGHDDLFKLYELAIDEHHYYIDIRDSRVTFYVGILSALVTVLGVGLFQASEWYQFAFLSLSSLLISAVSKIAVEATRLTYRRQLESITVRAKIEQQLGLTQVSWADAADSHSSWASEPLIPARHIAVRESHDSSDAFILRNLAKGSQLWTERMFKGSLLVGILLCVLLALLTLSKLPC